MRKPSELTASEIKRVMRFIESNIDVVMIEKHAHCAFAFIEDDRLNVVEESGGDEFMSGELSHFVCDMCDEDIGKNICCIEDKNHALFEHVMGHLGME